MAAILAVMFGSYAEGKDGAERATASANVKGCGMWGGIRGVSRAATAAAKEDIQREHSGEGLKGDIGRLLVDQV